MKPFDKRLYHLTDHLVKSLNLASFIETETGVSLKYYGSGHNAKCHCPMPDHRDTNASFNLKLTDEDVWIFHCFGCGKKGTIIHFCMEYFGLRNKLEAIMYLCKHFDIKDKEDLILASIKNVSKRIDIQRKMENANILTSSACRRLLQQDFVKHNEWVANAYKQLNKALDEENYDLVEQIGYDASNRVSGG